MPGATRAREMHIISQPTQLLSLFRAIFFFLLLRNLHGGWRFRSFETVENGIRAFSAL